VRTGPHPDNQDDGTESTIRLAGSGGRVIGVTTPEAMVTWACAHQGGRVLCAQAVSGQRRSTDRTNLCAGATALGGATATANRSLLARGGRCDSCRLANCIRELGREHPRALALCPKPRRRGRSGAVTNLLIHSSAGCPANWTDTQLRAHDTPS